MTTQKLLNRKPFATETFGPKPLLHQCPYAQKSLDTKRLLHLKPQMSCMQHSKTKLSNENLSSSSAREHLQISQSKIKHPQLFKPTENVLSKSLRFSQSKVKRSKIFQLHQQMKIYLVNPFQNIQGLPHQIFRISAGQQMSWHSRLRNFKSQSRMRRFPKLIRLSEDLHTSHAT